MNFIESVQVCLSKYVDFNGRASRSEYWWFQLLAWICSLLGGVSLIFSILLLAIILPLFAVQSRRLHDIDKSGWWQLIIFIPLIGMIILYVWGAQKGDDHVNRYG